MRLHTALRTGVTLTALAVFVPVWLSTWHAGIPLVLQVASVVLLATTVARPDAGLLIVAALLPLSTPLQIATQATFTGAMAIQFLALPFVLGACVRVGRRQSSDERRLVWPALVLAAVLAANLLVDLASTQQYTAWPSEFAAALWQAVARDYFTSGDFPMVRATIAWWLALALAVAAEQMLVADAALRTRVTRMLIVGAAGAGLLSALRFVEVMVRRGEFWSPLVELSTTRFNPILPDINAAGSLFALLALPAVWLAWTRSWRWALPLALPILLTLWTSGSRTAFAAFGLAFALAVGLSRDWTRRQVAGGVLLTAAAVVLAVVVVTGGGRATMGTATVIRAEMAAISLRLARDRPLFGYGLGRFPGASAPLVSEELKRTWPAATRGENAHNYYLQVLVELGLVGLAGFLWLAVAAVGPLVGQVRSRRLEPAGVGLAAGMVAFLLTCLAGHPLLLPEVLLPFGLCAGIAAAWAPPRQPRPWLRLAAAGVVLFALAAAPVRAWQVRSTADLGGVVIGGEFVEGSADESGWHVRDRIRWFVDATTERVVVPLRRADASAAPCTADVFVNDRMVNQVVPPEDRWVDVTVALALPGANRRPSQTVDVRVRGEGCEIVAGSLRARP